MNHNKNLDDKLYVSSTYQFLIFIFSLIVLASAITIKYKAFNPYENIEKLKIKENPDNQNIIVGLTINDFGEFHIEQNDFNFEGTLWFNFDETKVSLDLIKKFRILHGKIRHKSNPIINKHNSRTTAFFDINVSFKNILNFKKFPIDDHYITIEIINKYLPDNIEFCTVSNSFEIPDDINIPGWKLMNEKIFAGYRIINFKNINKDTDFSTKQKEVLFVFGFERTDLFRVIVIIIILLLLIFMVNFAYSVSSKISAQTASILIQGIPAIIAFWFIIVSLSPEQVGYFTFCDGIFIACVGSIFLSIILWTYAHHKKLSLKKRKFIISIPYIFFITLTLIFLLLF